MHNKVLRPILKDCAQKRGYKIIRMTVWKAGESFGRAINLQGSQWGPSTYINIGIFFLTPGLKGPPRVWDYHERAERIDGPFSEVVTNLANPHPRELTTDEVRDAFSWLLDWADETYSRDDYIRAILQDPQSSMSRHHPFTSDRLRAWAVQSKGNS